MIHNPMETLLEKNIQTPESDSEEEIPYYDEEFDLMQGDSHKEAIALFLPAFSYISFDQGLKLRSDQPASYIDPATNQERKVAGDIVLADTDKIENVTSKEILFVLGIRTRMAG